MSTAASCRPPTSGASSSASTAWRSRRWSTIRSSPDLGDDQVQVQARVQAAGQVLQLDGAGNGPVDAFVAGLSKATGAAVRVLDYHEHAIGSGAQARAAAYLELRVADGRTLFGVGIDANIVTASMKAVLSGLHRAGLLKAADAAAVAFAE